MAPTTKYVHFQVFDHGCDAINAGVGAMNLLVVLGICSGGEKVGGWVCG